MRALPAADLDWKGVRFLDPMGRVFEYEGEFYRAIYPHKVDYVRSLFAKGIVDRLVDKGLIVETRITDLKVDGYRLVLWHRRIPFRTRPEEWTRKFLKDAALCGIELNLELLPFGLGTVDFHCANIQQQGKCSPVWIDLGSICPLESINQGKSALLEFQKHYLHPLYLLSKNKNLNRVCRLLLAGGGIEPDEFNDLSNDPISISGQDRRHLLENLQKWISSLSFPSLTTKWGDYQPKSLKFNSNPNKADPRSQIVYDIIRDFQPKKVVDLSCNAGKFSLMAARLGADVYSVDLDECALERLYDLTKNIDENLSITVALRNLAVEQKQTIQGEFALALALSHHIKISQKFPFEQIAKVFSSYTTEALLTEFMPNGLGGNSPVPNPLPSDYSLENFINAFEPYFRRIETIYYPVPKEWSYRIFILCTEKKQSHECQEGLSERYTSIFDPLNKKAKVSVICQYCSRIFQFSNSTHPACPNCKKDFDFKKFRPEAYRVTQNSIYKSPSTAAINLREGILGKEQKSNKLTEILNHKIEVSDLLSESKRPSAKCANITSDSLTKVVHLCTQDFGGAGKAAHRLHKGLLQNGVASTMLVLNKQSGDPSVKVFPSKYSGPMMPALNASTHFSPLWSRQIHRWQSEMTKYPNRPAGLEMFTDALSDIQLEQIQDVKDAELINLHWVAGILDFHSAPISFRGKHIVWTLHDMNPFTGGCHYSGNCEKYKERCGACPQLGSSVEDDLSRQIWNLKYYAFQNLDLNIVAPSKWLANCASKSSLFSRFPVSVIPYGFPLDTFKPYSKNEIRRSLNIPENANVILFGADSIVNARKGFAYLLETIKRLPTNDKFPMVVLTFGSFPQGLQIDTKHQVLHLGLIVDENQLALAYSAADVFVIPSLEDNLPNTVIEAMACGVPVVGFEIGGIPDMIDHKKNGFLAKPRNLDSLLDGIDWALSLRDGGKNISALCRERVETKFALEIQANAYEELYDAIASKESLKFEDISMKHERLGFYSSRNSKHEHIKQDLEEETNTEKDKQIIKKVKTEEKKYLISAIVSTYNAERFIRGCLEDLERQTIADQLEIIVINSGSQQNEDRIIREFQNKYSNIKYIKTDRRETVYAAWNRGIQAANGKFITNANTDDRHRKDALEVMAKTLEANLEIALVYADLMITETENERFETATPVGFFKWLDFNRDDLLNKGCFMGPQPMWRKEVHDEYGYFDPSYVTSGDYEFWLRISQSHKFLHLPVQLGLYLRSSGSIEHTNRIKQIVENNKILNLYRKAQSCNKIIRRIQTGTSRSHTETRSEDMKSPETIYRKIQTEIGNKHPEEVITELEPVNEAAQNNLTKLSQINSVPSETMTPEEIYQEIIPLLNNGDPHKAIASLTDLLSRFPDFALAHNDLGVLFYHTDDKEKARLHYERAVELMPDNLNFQKNLADFYCIELGRIEDALQIYVNILKVDPQDIETLMATGQICKALEKFDDAKHFFNQVLQIEPWNADACKYITEMENQLSEARLDSESVEDAYRNLQERLKTATPAEAIVQFKQFVETYPDFAIGHNDLASLYYNTGDKEKALRHYQQAAHLQPANITLQKNLADFMFVELGKVEEGLQIYLAILALNPDDVETLLIAGHICAALKKFDDAKDFYERILAIVPDNQDARQNLKAINDRKKELSFSPSHAPNDNNISSHKFEAADLDDKRFDNTNTESRIIVSIVVSLDGMQNCIKQCIESIQTHTAESHEIILVNNGATKGLLKWAQNLVKNNPHYQLVKCDKKYSWAQCLNLAVKASVGDYIVLIHNDVKVAKRWFTGMHECLKAESGTGVVGPLTNATAGIQKVHLVDDWDPRRLESDAEAFYEQNQYRRIPTIQIASFCLMFSRELIEEIGGFDAQLVSEQAVVTDFCKRSAAWGFQNCVAGDVFVYHANRHKRTHTTSNEGQIPVQDKERLNSNWSETKGDQTLPKGIQMVSLLETVNELHQKGYIEQAIETLLNAIGALPHEKRFYLALGQILISSKRYQDAIDTINEMAADEKDPMDPKESDHLSAPGPASISLTGSENLEMKTLEILGYAEEGLENFAVAEDYAERMLAIDAKSARAFNLKGVLAFRKKDLNAAAQFFERAIASDRGAGEPYSNLAAVKLASNMEQEAFDLIEKGFNLSPTDFDIASNYHAAVSESGDYHIAEKAVGEAAALYPNNRKIAYTLIDFLVQQGRYDAAMDKIEAAIVKFGIEDGILTAALQVRKKLGPMKIKSRMNKPAVSCCMIIKDEEKYLARCLTSVKPIVDEMIVVDTGSADRSKDIAAAFGAQVYDLEWQDDFAKARNFSLEKASGDWILIIDGDEVISSLDYQDFNQIVKNRPKAPVAYTIVTRNYSALPNIVGWVPNDGKYANEEAAAGWIPSVKTRLFYGKDQICFEGAVHELVDPVVKRKGFKTKQCNIPVHHYGRLDKERLTRKGEVYFEIGKKKMEEMGDDIFAVREMAIQATTLERNEMAIKLWRKLITLDPSELMVADAYINMATLYNRLGNFEQALLEAKKAVAKAPHVKESLYNYALAELHVGNAQATIKVLEDLVKRMPDYPPARFILSAAYFCIAEKEKGFKIIRKLQATALGPNLIYPVAELAETLLNARQNEFAQRLLGAAIEGDIANKRILELFNKCLQLSEKTENYTESLRVVAAGSAAH